MLRLYKLLNHFLQLTHNYMNYSFWSGKSINNILSFDCVASSHQIEASATSFKIGASLCITISLYAHSFSRCVHLLSPDNDTIYGCIKGNETRGSDRFRLLGLFNVLGYHHSSKCEYIVSPELYVVYTPSLAARCITLTCSLRQI